MSKSACPCCSNTLLRHIRSGSVYWFCRHCYQEMPENNNNNHKKNQVASLNIGLLKDSA